MYQFLNITILCALAVLLSSCGLLRKRHPCDEWPPMAFCGDEEDRPTQLLIYTPRQVLIEYTHGDTKEALELARKYCAINDHYPVKQSSKLDTIPGLKEGMKVAVYNCVERMSKKKKSVGGNCGCKKK